MGLVQRSLTTSSSKSPLRSSFLCLSNFVSCCFILFTRCRFLFWNKDLDSREFLSFWVLRRKEKKVILFCAIIVQLTLLSLLFHFSKHPSFSLAGNWAAWFPALAWHRSPHHGLRHPQGKDRVQLQCHYPSGKKPSARFEWKFGGCEYLVKVMADLSRHFHSG